MIFISNQTDVDLTFGISLSAFCLDSTLCHYFFVLLSYVNIVPWLFLYRMTCLLVFHLFQSKMHNIVTHDVTNVIFANGDDVEQVVAQFYDQFDQSKVRRPK